MMSSQTVHVKQNIQKAQAATDAQLEFTFEQRAKEGSAVGGWDYRSSVVNQTRTHQKGPNKVQSTKARQSARSSLAALWWHLMSRSRQERGRVAELD